MIGLIRLEYIQYKEFLLRWGSCSIHRTLCNILNDSFLIVVDGQWGSWASWATCSVTCASGTQNRQRQCDSPAQQHNGLDCVGSGSDTKTCTKVACPGMVLYF